MELVDILLIVSAVVIVFVMWAIVGVRHLKNLEGNIEEQWDMLNALLRKRQDLIPNLIETVRAFGGEQGELIEKLIAKRMCAAKEYDPGAKKIEYEHDLSATINKMIALGYAVSELGKDTNFLELKGEINKLEMAIEEKSRDYNMAVRRYNKHRRAFFLLPLVAVFRFGNVNVFEVEV